MFKDGICSRGKQSHRLPHHHYFFVAELRSVAQHGGGEEINIANGRDCFTILDKDPSFKGLLEQETDTQGENSCLAK